MKQPIRILGICLLMLAANLEAQAQGPNSPPLVVHFSGTDTFTFFTDCTGETVAAEISFAGVITQTITVPGGCTAARTNPASVVTSATTTAQGRHTAKEFVDLWRARLAQRYHMRELGTQRN